jgi:integron integrase
MRDKMRLDHMAKSTESSYTAHVTQFFAWLHWKTPDQIDGQDVTDYLTHLAVDNKVSASTQNQAFNALLFMFRYVLKKEMGKVNSVRAKTSQHVPEFLSRDELKSLFAQLSGDWLLLSRLGYGTGMRLMELLRLRIKDVDFGNGIINIRDGKGAKDRVVPMPKSLRADLLLRVENTKHIHAEDLQRGFGSVWLPDALAKKYPNAPKDFKWQWLFPSREICKADDGAMRRHHLFPTGFQTELRKAGLRAKINKRVHPHCLRHSFASHYLENSGNLILLKELMGHKDVTTTQIYTHTLEARNAVSPADVL